MTESAQAVQPSNINAATGAPILRKTLSGALAERYGALPIVPLPSDDSPILGFVWDVADILKDSGIYRRDHIVVIPDNEKRRISDMKPEIFCTWSQRFFLGSKIRYDSNDEPFEVIKDIPLDLAIKTLASLDFVPRMPEIQKVLPAPMPFFNGDDLDVTPVGFHNETGSYTYRI